MAEAVGSKKSGLGGVSWPVVGLIAVASVWALAGFPVPKELRTKFTCENMVADVLETSASNVTALQPLKIIAIVNIQEISKDEKTVACKGLAKLSNNTDVGLQYRAYEQDKQWFISFQPDA